MGIRVNKLLTELNIGLATLDNMLRVLGYKEQNLTTNTKLSDDIAILVKELYSDDGTFLNLIKTAATKGLYGNQTDLPPTMKVLGRIDLDEYYHSRSKQALKKGQNDTLTVYVPEYCEKQSFWISELGLLSPENEVNSINIGSFDEAESLPLYSVLIGTNGVGKSCLMKEIVDFFIDLHSCKNEPNPSMSSANKGRLKGIRYHIDGVECEVIRLKKNFLTKINGHFCSLNDLRIPSIVACHFGAFDKFPTQKVNGSAQTRYDVPCYKYVGAHVNGSMISSSAIAFRLLFALNEQMNDWQRQNICSILDFIGYDHRVSLSYSLVMKSKTDGAALDAIKQRVNKDKEYSKLDKQQKNVKATQLYNYYKKKTSTGNSRHDYEIDFDEDIAKEESHDELQFIYKLKQCELVNSTNVIFHKQGCDVTSEDMSSGEFAMLSTVLSISAAANDPHTLVLLDEPELSLHPNWQMTLIDNLDRALSNQVCQLLIATHSHMLVSDLPMKRSSVTQVEKDERDNLFANSISECTYGWSAEEVLLKVFKTATDRNRYFGERIGKLLEKIGSNTITPKEVKAELNELQEISMHLSKIDPMKQILNTIVETYQ